MIRPNGRITVQILGSRSKVVLTTGENWAITEIETWDTKRWWYPELSILSKSYQNHQVIKLTGLAAVHHKVEKHTGMVRSRNRGHLQAIRVHSPTTVSPSPCVYIPSSLWLFEGPVWFTKGKSLGLVYPWISLVCCCKLKVTLIQEWHWKTTAKQTKQKH